MRCQYCGAVDVPVELNHIKPKYLGGTDKDGRMYLCKPCHDKFHIMLDKIVNAIADFMNNYPPS